jgi:hypothetical protein
MLKLLFPDHTEINCHQTFSILDVAEGQSLVAYLDKEAGLQTLWVPNDFVIDK